MRSGVSAGIVAALLAAVCCGACTGVEDKPPTGPPAAESLTATRFREAAVEIVEQRESALKDRDRDAFLATVDDDELQFVATQSRWFDNLALMPLADLRLEVVGKPTTDAEEGELQLPVDFTMRLDGFEERSVTQRLLYTFRQVDGAVGLVNDRNTQRDRRTGWLPDPWDVGDVVVRESGSILGFFDEETAPYADAVMKDLKASQETVLTAVPDWSGQLVAYDISDLTGLEKRTPMQVWETGGVAYPVMVRPGSKEVAAVRFIVNPDVAHNSLHREFLLRHELAHVALGSRDDASPRWLTEGAAEYVSRTQYSVAQQRRMASYAVEYFGLTAPFLVNGSDFYADPNLNYEVASIACTYLASTRGPEILWSLMDAFTADRDLMPMSAAQIDAILQREIGLDSIGLARAAVAWAAAGG